jgi:uncharacterized protein YbaP (TraB family)
MRWSHRLGRLWVHALGTLGALACATGAAGQSTAAECPPATQPPTQAQMQAAAQAARDRGALWKLTRDGRVSYLYGTIHVGKLEWAFPGPQVRSALQATDTVALEIDPTDPQLLQRMAPAAVGAANPLALAAALKQRLSRRVDAACLPPQARPSIEAQHPVMQTLSLSILEARWEGLDAGYAQEFVLAGFARAAQRRIVSLETPEQQVAALMPAEPEAAQQMISGMLDQLEKGTGRRAIARLATAWERGDLDDMAQYERWCDCAVTEDDRRQLARLIDDRNPALADRIDVLHREGARLFVGIGALHMVGPQALPRLLAAKGFAVERVAYP